MNIDRDTARGLALLDGQRVQSARWVGDGSVVLTLEGNTTVELFATTGDGGDEPRVQAHVPASDFPFTAEGDDRFIVVRRVRGRKAVPYIFDRLEKTSTIAPDHTPPAQYASELSGLYRDAYRVRPV